VDILADPGTYCYHGEPAWRSYFRSTLAHNTIELGGQDQSGDGGPFLWLRHANGREIEVADDGETASWTAEHDGYLSLQPPVHHRRSVRLDRASRRVDIIDEIDSDGHEVRLAFHLGPKVEVEFHDGRAMLSWLEASIPGAARLTLPPQLQWGVHRGETDPILGWYSPGLGQRVPTSTFLGHGRYTSGVPLRTRLEFLDVGMREDLAVIRSAASR
jgi:hypothetical protein